MSKRLHLVILAVLIFVASINVNVFADDGVGFEYNEKGQRINIEQVKLYRWLIYGQPTEVKPNEKKENQWRYLGFDLKGNPFSNPNFPNDADSGRKPYEKSWIEAPWEVISPNKLCVQSDYNNMQRDQVIDWLNHMVNNKFSGQLWSFGSTGWTGEKLVDYLNVMSPPSEYAPGAARGWHKDSNGKAWYETFIIPPLNDIHLDVNNLALVNFSNTASSIAKGKTYQAAVDVVNYTGKDWIGVPIQFYINDQLEFTGNVDVPAEGTAVNIEYTLPKEYDQTKLRLEARLNMIEPRTVLEESTYEDNIASLSLGVIKQGMDELDLEVTHISNSKFFKGQYGSITVHIKNKSNVPISNPKVPVRLTINGTSVTLTKNISIPPNGSAAINFKVQVPENIDSFTVKGEVNHSKIYQEIDYTNNFKPKTIPVTGGTNTSNCDDNYTTWTEYRSVDEYNGGKIIERHYVTYEECTTRTNSKGEEVERCKTYKVLVGYTVEFWARLNTSVTVSPTTTKTGYGIDTFAETWVTTNYDDPGALSNAQRVLAYYPSSKNPVELEVMSGDPGNATSRVKWRLPRNNNSVFKERKHYIPLEWKDGPYPVKVQILDASTPGGSLCKLGNATVTIKGTMHEDDHTAIK